MCTVIDTCPSCCLLPPHWPPPQASQACHFLSGQLAAQRQAPLTVDPLYFRFRSAQRYRASVCPARTPRGKTSPALRGSRWGQVTTGGVLSTSASSISALEVARGGLREATLEGRPKLCRHLGKALLAEGTAAAKPRARTGAARKPTAAEVRGHGSLGRDASTLCELGCQDEV